MAFDLSRVSTDDRKASETNASVRKIPVTKRETT